MTTELTAERFFEDLQVHQSQEEYEKIQRYFKTGESDYGEGDIFMGVRMGQVFTLAKAYIDMPLAEIEKLLDHPIHEARVGAVKIMALQAAHKKTSPERKTELYDLYLRRHDRINNWDLVDLGARDVIGGYLADRPRDILYELAHSDNLWERRTAIVSTAYFIREGELDDTYKIAEILLNDEEHLIHKAVGGWLREAGKQDQQRLACFVGQYAATMPRTLLRYAIEHFDKEQRAYYMGLKAK